MSQAWYSLSNTLDEFSRAWHRFFHAPQDTRICALIRIAYAALLLVNLAVLYPDLQLWFTDHGVMPESVSKEIGDGYKWSLLWLLPSTPDVVRACFLVFALQTFMLLIGLFSRASALCVFIWLLSFQNRNWQILDGEDFVFRCILFFLILMPCGHCWSVDRIIGNWYLRRATILSEDCCRPAWGLRLLQLQMAFIFLSAGLWKLGGTDWLNGTAVYYVSRLDDYFGRGPVPNWLFDTPWTVALLTWSVLLIELLVPLLIWFRETRRACLVILVLFHLGSDYSMHLFLFHWIMLVGWLAFLIPEDWAWLGRPQQSKRPSEATT